MMGQKCETETIQIHQIVLPTHFAVGPVNSFVLIDGEERILVDCGPKLDSTREALIEGLHRLHLSVEDITGVVLTHGHIDHVGLTALFQSRGIPVYGHPEVSSWLDADSPGEAYRRAFYESFYAKMGLSGEYLQAALNEYLLYHKFNDPSVVNHELLPLQTFAPLPKFKVLYVPGHAQAAIALWCEESGQLIAGDQLLPHISSNALIEPVPGARSGGEANWTKSLIQYRKNLRFLAELPIQTVYPGHGPVFSNAQALILARLNEQERRRDKLLRLLEKTGPISAFGLALLYFPKHQDQGSLILSETLGHLDWLQDEGMVVSEAAKNGVILWRSRS
jgi:glyoxylase-like metal-dependent hydrolase (beta-lactamase superfamily II)